MAALLDVTPQLQNGDRLTRAEFERRYAAMPNLKKAELIEGEVHLPSPVSLMGHGGPHGQVVTWLGVYVSMTPGVLFGDNATVRLDNDNEPQPDVFLMIPEAAGGQAGVGEDGYVDGAPELVVEVASSTVSIDLHKKKNAYRRNGVQEYIVWRVQDKAIDWFILREGAYESLQTDGNGMYRSVVLPGLILDPAALIAGDLRRVLEIQQAAAQQKDHHEFAKKLETASNISLD